MGPDLRISAQSRSAAGSLRATAVADGHVVANGSVWESDLTRRFPDIVIGTATCGHTCATGEKLVGQHRSLGVVDETPRIAAV